MQNSLLKDRIRPFAVALIVFAAANSLTIGYSAEAAGLKEAIEKYCDVVQAFRNRWVDRPTVGYVTRLEIAGRKLSPDLVLTNPKNKKIKVVGVLESFFWPGRRDDLLYFSMHVSRNNRNAVNALLHSHVKDASVEIEFAIYESLLSKESPVPKYFRAVHSDDMAIGGHLPREMGKLSIEIGRSAGPAIGSTHIDPLSLRMMPLKKGQIIKLATGLHKKTDRVWGPRPN